MTGTADGLLVRLFRAAGLLGRVVNFLRFAAAEVATALGDCGGFLFSPQQGHNSLMGKTSRPTTSVGQLQVLSEVLQAEEIFWVLPH